MKYIGLFDEKEDIVTKEKLEAVEAAIPTKTSQLDNDSGFITSAPVTSVNTKIGAVTLSASDVGAQPTITVNGIIKGDGAGNLSVAELNPSSVGLGNVDNVKQYSASNPPPYPVKSVNSKTGAVTLTATDLGAATTSDIHTALNRTNAVNVSDSNYTTYMARGIALSATEQTPSVNGAICLVYG